MKKILLNNGMTLILEKTESNSVTLSVCVKTGSNNEDNNLRGISHFLEHMIFEGTKNRTNIEIVKEIEGLGGEFNAFTSHETTFFYIKILSKYFDKALEIISDILKNSIFEEKIIEKERKVILEEMNLWKDDPKSYQWGLFEKALYKNHPSKYPVIGFKETLNNVKRKEIINYFNNYYVPNNICIVVTGNFDSLTEKKLKNEFNDLKPKKIETKIFLDEQQFENKIEEKKHVSHSYYIIGFKTINVDNKDSYVLDLVSIILGYGQSSRLFNEIRTKRGLSYNTGATHDCNKTYGYFAAYVSAEHKNVKLCKELILKEFKLKNLTEKEIEDAKKFLEGTILLRNEDTKELAVSLGHWEYYKNDAKEFYEYIKKIKKVSKNDILRVLKKYFTDKYTEVLLHN